MSIEIDDPDVERALRKLAQDRGEPVERLAARLLKEELAVADDHRGSAAPAKDQNEDELATAIRDLQERFHRSLADAASSDDALVGYDADGLPS
jgi:hypothetical protein